MIMMDRRNNENYHHHQKRMTTMTCFWMMIRPLFWIWLISWQQRERVAIAINAATFIGTVVAVAVVVTATMRDNNDNADYSSSQEILCDGVVKDNPLWFSLRRRQGRQHREAAADDDESVQGICENVLRAHRPTFGSSSHLKYKVYYQKWQCSLIHLNFPIHLPQL